MWRRIAGRRVRLRGYASIESATRIVTVIGGRAAARPWESIMPSAKELREKRLVAAKAIRDLRDKLNPETYPKFSDEDEAAWQRANEDYDSLGRQIEIADRAEQIALDLEVPIDPRRASRAAESAAIPDNEARDLALRAWLRSPVNDMSNRERAACRQLKFKPARRSIDLVIDGTGALKPTLQNLHRTRHGSAIREYYASEARDLSAVIGGKGGFTVSPGSMAAFQTNQLAFGPMLAEVDIISTRSGEPLHWPGADDTGNEGSVVGESGSTGTSTDPTYKEQVFGAIKYHSQQVRVPSEFLDDTTLNFESWLSGALGERIGRITNRHLTTGTGGAQMRGVTISAPTGKTTAASGAITYEELIDLEHSIDPAYRNGDCVWMVHDNILAVLRKLKDAENRPLWQDGLSTGVPDRLLGYRVVINQHMASSVATTNVTVVFGNLNFVKLRRVNTLRLVRLDELYAGNDQVGFDLFVRQDGDLLNFGTSPVKKMVQV